MKIIQGISASVREAEASVIERVRKKLGLDVSVPVSVYRKSIDARKRSDIKYVYSFVIETADDIPNAVNTCDYSFSPEKTYKSARPLVVGMGPAGLFCAYILALNGAKPIIVERGKDVDRRAEDVQKFWNGDAICPDSNVQFGEGGAGSFSDGKLVTRITDPRCRFVLETFVRFGADPDILKNAKPHVGTDILRKVVRNMRKEIIRLGGEVRFQTKLTGLDLSENRINSVFLNGERYNCGICVLAVGNGARDTYRMLLEQPLQIAPKPFSVGFRMEHLQEDINHAMYGDFADMLPAADYSFSKVFDKAKGCAAYTFCMCPGGYVINASSEPDGTVTNGMSYHARDGVNSNSALLINVTEKDFGSDHPLAGAEYQRAVERRVYELTGGYRPVVQTVGDFLTGRSGTTPSGVLPSVETGYVLGDLREVLPRKIADGIKNGLPLAARKIRGFDAPDAVLTGAETRSSSPVRILRDEKGTSSMDGLYPIGEGAGYAGGITSAAADGIRTVLQSI